MMEEDRLGRLVQCRCQHTCLPDSKYGYQWLLPRTKSKHMLYQHVQQKNKSDKSTVDQIQQQLLSFSLLNKQTNSKIKKKKKHSFKMPILMEIELKKKSNSSENNNTILKEFFVKTSYN